MKIELKGNEGKYIVSNESNIVQYKLDQDGRETGEYVIHSTIDTIENTEDRITIDKTLENF